MTVESVPPSIIIFYPYLIEHPGYILYSHESPRGISHRYHLRVQKPNYADTADGSRRDGRTGWLPVRL